MTAAEKITFSAFNPNADVHLPAQRLTWEGLYVVGMIRADKGHIWFSVLVRQSVTTFMAAAALALAAGLPTSPAAPSHSGSPQYQRAPLHDPRWASLAAL